MALIGYWDLESTGAKPETDRICEIAMIVTDEFNNEKMRISKRINPLCHIQVRATAVHGISDADVMGCQTFQDVAKSFAALFGKLDLAVAHNGDEFDCVMLLNEFIRVGVPLPKFPPTLDTMKTGRWATSDGKIPTLGELCWSLDVPYDPALAHAALYDVEVMRAAHHEGMRIGVYPRITAKETKDGTGNHAEGSSAPRAEAA